MLFICNSFTFPSFFTSCHPYIPFYWRVGASQPSRSTGTIFQYPGAVTFRIVLRISKYTTNAVLHHVVIEISRLSESPCRHHVFMPAVNVFMQAAHCTDANRRVHCHNVNIIFIDYVANNHGYKPRKLKSMFHAAIISWIAPARQKCTIHLLVFTDEVSLCPGCLYYNDDLVNESTKVQNPRRNSYAVNSSYAAMHIHT